MKVESSSRFIRDIRRISAPALARRVNQKIAEIEAAASIRDVSNVRRLNTPRGMHYRVRIGDYRLGITLDGEVAILVAFGPRDDIYRTFP